MIYFLVFWIGVLFGHVLTEYQWNSFFRRLFKRYGQDADITISQSYATWSPSNRMVVKVQDWRRDRCSIMTVHAKSVRLAFAELIHQPEPVTEKD